MVLVKKAQVVTEVGVGDCGICDGDCGVDAEYVSGLFTSISP